MEGMNMPYVSEDEGKWVMANPPCKEAGYCPTTPPKKNDEELKEKGERGHNCPV